jgi:methyltransferase-like protein
MAELTRQDDEASIYNLWHEALLLSPVDRHVVPLLDGSRDRDALLEALLAIDREHEIAIERDGEPVSGEAERLQAFSEYVDALPRHLEEMKLLRVG